MSHMDQCMMVPWYHPQTLLKFDGEAAPVWYDHDPVSRNVYDHVHVAIWKHGESTMAKRLHYTQDEWLTLARAPTQVALAVMGTGGTSPFQMVRELIGLGEALRETGQATSAGRLVRELNVEAQAQLNEIAQQQSATIDLTGLRAQALETCRRVAAVVDAKEPAAAADEYKHWVLWLGRRVAAAAGEGDVQPISAGEAELLAELAGALGLRQRQVGATAADQPPIGSADRPPDPGTDIVGRAPSAAEE
jgi:hypothetical protein